MKQLAILVLLWETSWGASLTGRLADPQGQSVAGAAVTLSGGAAPLAATTDDAGVFRFATVPAGAYRLRAEAPGFVPIARPVEIAAEAAAAADLQFTAVADQRQQVTVVADVTDRGIWNPDPAQRVAVRQEMLDANPGRPGMPVSIPGMPVESPAGGIKPPQYFVPGVAGDHGEPIAQFLQVGGYLFPNNLPANAHGNGYADPNILIPLAIESVETDGGAFNVREGNNSVNAAMTFGLRQRILPVLQITGDSRDCNAVAGWSPARPETRAWIGLEFSSGNGFLARPEHRRQYKINASRVFDFGRHEVTVYGIGYYGFSYLPGLVPIDARVPGDTIDWRQSEQASSGIAIANDVWHVSDATEVQFSGFFRTYNLDVRPNFGDGLIRQSEFRTASGESADWSRRLRKSMVLLAGFEQRRDAPRGLDLDRFSEQAARFLPVTSSDVTLNFYTPYVALDGAPLRWLHYDVGFRRDEVNVDNRDRLLPPLSFSKLQGVSSPKATLSFTPPQSLPLPAVSLSYGQAFAVDDPRIGASALVGGTVISKARSYQMVVHKTVARTDLRLTFEHVTVAQQLAKLDNDTGLQMDVGPALIRSMTASARRYFGRGSLAVSFSQADARDRWTGQPTPEAPRLIGDVLGTLDRLPLHLEARGEYEYVGAKPLGDGFRAVPVKEFRGAIFRSFEDRRMDIGVHFFLARGYAGQTLETLALAGETDPLERIVGFRLKSYVTASCTWHFGGRGAR